MPIKNKVLRFAVALAAITGIASQLPLSGAVAFAKNRCTQGGPGDYIITASFRSNRGVRDTYFVPRRSSGLTFYTFFTSPFSNRGRPTFTTESSRFTLSGSAFSFSPNTLVTTATGASVRVFRLNRQGTGSATLTAQSLSNPNLVTTVELR